MANSIAVTVASRRNSLDGAAARVGSALERRLPLTSKNTIPAPQKSRIVLFIGSLILSLSFPPTPHECVNNRQPTVNINLLPKLDFARHCKEKQWIVLFWPNNFYEEWRQHGVAGGSLRDADPTPPEKLLQQIWLHQRIHRDGITTIDGQSVRILHPGFWNHEAGPDFRNAIVQFGNDPPRVGSVEIDLSPSFWQSHGHESNPRYRDVILHVVWQGSKPTQGRATLLLKPLLDAPLEELALWFAAEELPGPQASIGKCSAPLRNLKGESITELLRQAAQVRLHRKATQLQARARETGWEQALWEFALSALGYKHNRWPMRRLAELNPWLSGNSKNPQSLEARLLGLGNLLPRESKAGSVHLHLRELWDVWWREADAVRSLILPRESWCMAGLRPVNQPVRRLALAAGWLAEGRMIPRLERWLEQSLPDEALPRTLEAAFAVAPHPFWQSHWTFRSSIQGTPQPMLGLTRATDLAINVVLPWLWMRAVASQNDSLRRVAEHRYFAWPASQDNATLKLARLRLLGETKSALFKTSSAQQGLLQIAQDFCNHSNALCEGCPFPELVQAWQVRLSGGVQSVDRSITPL